MAGSGTFQLAVRCSLKRLSSRIEGFVEFPHVCKYHKLGGYKSIFVPASATSDLAGSGAPVGREMFAMQFRIGLFLSKYLTSVWHGFDCWHADYE